MTTNDFYILCRMTLDNLAGNHHGKIILTIEHGYGAGFAYDGRIIVLPCRQYSRCKDFIRDVIDTCSRLGETW